MARVLLNRYELEVPLGRGATGEVWRGHDMATRKPVAVKIFELAGLEGSALLAETIARFRREAATLARLRHPNIVAALEAGRIDNELFLVMELAEGTSLASMLDQRMANNLGLLPVPSLLRIAEQACAGLAAAHSAGVVHRDIKPSNLMVAAGLNTKIIDFGIARLLDDNVTRLTQHAVGTPTYIAPEQLQNHRDVDGRADLYSLGCVLYEQLAGRPPFEAEVPSALLVMHVKQRPVPLDSIRSDLPVGLSRLVDRLMEKDRAERPADAAQVLSYLTAISTRADRSRPAQEADRETLAGANPPPAAMPEADRSTNLAPSQREGAATGGQAAGHRAKPSFVPHGAPSPHVRGTRDPGGQEAMAPPPQPLSPAAYQATEAMLPGRLLAGQDSGRPDREGQRPAGPSSQPDPPTTSRGRRSGWWGSLFTRARRKRT